MWTKRTTWTKGEGAWEGTTRATREMQQALAVAVEGLSLAGELKSEVSVQLLLLMLSAVGLAGLAAMAMATAMATAMAVLVVLLM